MHFDKLIITEDKKSKSKKITSDMSDEEVIFNKLDSKNGLTGRDLEKHRKLKQKVEEQVPIGKDKNKIFTIIIWNNKITVEDNRHLNKQIFSTTVKSGIKENLKRVTDFYPLNISELLDPFKLLENVSISNNK